MAISIEITTSVFGSEKGDLRVKGVQIFEMLSMYYHQRDHPLLCSEAKRPKGDLRVDPKWNTRSTDS